MDEPVVAIFDSIEAFDHWHTKAMAKLEYPMESKKCGRRCRIVARYAEPMQVDGKRVAAIVHASQSVGLRTLSMDEARRKAIKRGLIQDNGFGEKR